MDVYEMQSSFRMALASESYKLETAHRPDYTACLSRITALRGSWAAFSILCESSFDSILLNARRTAFTPLGPWPVYRIEVAIDGLSPRVYLADMHEDDDEIRRADALLTQEEAMLRPYRPRQLFVVAPIGEAVEPGAHQGRVSVFVHTLFEDEVKILEQPVVVDVRNVRVPRPGQGAFHLNLWQHPANIARKHEVALFSDAHFVILEEYARALFDIGNKAASLIVSDIPWAGQYTFNDWDERANLFEYSFIRVTRGKDGAFRYDFSIAERYIELFDRYQMTDRIMITGLIGIWKDERAGYGNITEDCEDALRISYLDERTGGMRFMRKKEEIAAYIRALYEWTARAGIRDRCVIMADEPNNIDFSCADAARFIGEIAPEFHLEWDVPPDMMLTALNDTPVWDYTPSIEWIAQQPEKIQVIRERAKGLFLWSTCCWPLIPNSFLRSPLAEVRFHGMLTEFIGADGFLRWNFTAWPEHPRARITYRIGSWSAGDTCFVYPSQGGLCLKSLRYYALKRGIEDYELIQMVKARGMAGIIKAALDKVIRRPDFSQWEFDQFSCAESLYSLDGADYEAARGLLIDALEESTVK